MAQSSLFSLTEAGVTPAVPIDPEFATTTLIRVTGSIVGAALRVFGTFSAASVQLVAQDVSNGNAVTEINSAGVYRVDSSGFSSVYAEAPSGFLGSASVQFSTVLG